MTRGLRAQKEQVRRRGPAAPPTGDPRRKAAEGAARPAPAAAAAGRAARQDAAAQARGGRLRALLDRDSFPVHVQTSRYLQQQYKPLFYLPSQ